MRLLMMRSLCSLVRATVCFSSLRLAGVDVRMRSFRLVHKGVTIRLQVWDAGGFDSARPELNSIYTGVHGVVLCYDCLLYTSPSPRDS